MTHAELDTALKKEIERAIRRLRGRVRQLAREVDLRVATTETAPSLVYQALMDITPSFEASRVRLVRFTQRRPSPSSRGQ